MCSIPRGTNIAELIQMVTLILWDEAPVTHIQCFESVDRSMRDMAKPRREFSPRVRHKT
jgi:hypothetical protein